MNLPPSSSFLASIPLLLCEGESDERFLGRIFDTRELKAQQVGGASNLRPTAAYFTQQNQLVFTIQDRDFRPTSEAEECYSENYAGRHFMWRRHEPSGLCGYSTPSLKTRAIRQHALSCDCFGT